MGYFDIYQKRLNRFGIDYQSRIQNKRENEFQLYLNKSVYRVEFSYGENTQVGSFEKYKQDDTKTLHYLLTNVDLDMPAGTILMIPDDNGEEKPWMIYYLEHIEASGYNRYIMLRMSHYLTWTARDGSVHSSYAYLYGQEDNMLKDEIRSRSRMDTIYSENLKSSFFILPKNQYVKKDDYFIVGEDPFQEYYRVTGYDIQSTEGVEYVTIDPIYEYDLTPPPQQMPEDDPGDFYWLNGGDVMRANYGFTSEDGVDDITTEEDEDIESEG